MDDRKKIEDIKSRYPKGTKICLDSMEDDPNPIPSGTKGEVICVDDIGTLHCKFDNGRQLGVIPGKDIFHVIEQREEQQLKPDCPLIGQDGNIYNLMGIASRTLKDNGMRDQAKEMCDRITHSRSYDEALCVISDYVNITSVYDDEEEDMDEYMDEDMEEEPETGMNMSF